jgi:2,4-dienoyl-CoA reductase-like NADH-dependent reductase (Old Yellow Enzyme family)
MSKSRFPRLFSPLELRGKILRNRMVMPAMATHFADADGGISPAIADYLGARAAGGFAMVITENLGVHASGRSTGRMAMADSDDALPGLTGIADAVKRHGAIALAQINHSGRQTSSRVTGQELVAPSAIPCPLMREMPVMLDLGGIAAMQDAYVAATRRVEQAGFDGVEIHAAHGYLAASFLSPYSNHRTDSYGGDAAGRMRFLLEIVRRVRAQSDPGFIISARISAEEFVAGGLTADDAIVIGRALQAEGIDILSLSVGVFESYQQLTMLSGEAENPWLPIMGRIRQQLAIPVTGVGRIKRPESAEAALAAGQIDLAAFGRTALTNPDFPNAITEAAGTVESACIGCNLCLGRTADPEMVCPINPFVGREALLANLPLAAPARIVIEGGGFAALTAGWLAAMRGGDVTIVEPEGRFTGMQGFRSNVPGQEEYGAGAAALLARAREAGVCFSREMPPMPGGELWTVRRYEPVRLPDLPGQQLLSSFDILRAPDMVGRAARILVVGDDLSAADAALLLAERGHKVTLRSPAKDICFDAHPGFRRINRTLIEARGGSVEVRLPADALFEGEGFACIVVGRTPAISPDDPQAWRGPAREGARMLDDAYEPGAMTRTVYDAVDLALAMAPRSNPALATELES